MIRTERLHLRPPVVGDLDVIHGLTDDEESRRYLGSASRKEDSYRRLMMTVGGWAAHGYGVFALEDRTTGAIVGTGGLFRFLRTLDEGDQPEAVEAGWIIARPRWGEGLATEAMLAVHQWWDAAHGPGRTVCMIVPGNTPSERIAARLGYGPYLEGTHRGDPVRMYERLP